MKDKAITVAAIMFAILCAVWTVEAIHRLVSPPPPVYHWLKNPVY